MKVRRDTLYFDSRKFCQCFFRSSKLIFRALPKHYKDSVLAKFLRRKQIFEKRAFLGTLKKSVFFLFTCVHLILSKSLFFSFSLIKDVHFYTRDQRRVSLQIFFF